MSLPELDPKRLEEENQLLKEEIEELRWQKSGLEAQIEYLSDALSTAWRRDQG